METDCCLTTTDNPYNPFTEFDEWNAYDIEKGYNTCAYLARIGDTSIDMSPVEEAIAIETAMDEIVKENVLGIYKKVFPSDYTSGNTVNVQP